MRVGGWLKLTSIGSQPAQTTFSLRRRRRPAASTLFLFLRPLFLLLSCLSSCISLQASDRTPHLHERPAHELKPTSLPCLVGSKFLRLFDARTPKTLQSPRPNPPHQRRVSARAHQSPILAMPATLRATSLCPVGANPTRLPPRTARRTESVVSSNVGQGTTAMRRRMEGRLALLSGSSRRCILTQQSTVCYHPLSYHWSCV